METKQVVAALSALAQETRLGIFRLLVQAGPEGRSAGSIAEALGVPAATLSFHLAQLTHAGLISQRRMGRLLFYSADYDRMNALMGFLTENCCGIGTSIPSVCDPSRGAGDCRAGTAESKPGNTAGHHPGEPRAMADKVYNVLFLCTGNSARSIMAECLLRRWSAGRFNAFSAGSHPRGEAHPLALDLLKRRNHRVESLRSKSWDEFAGPDAPHLDFVFTVCDQAAGEICPAWPGQPMTAHWGVEDPATFVGTEEQRRRQFLRIYCELDNRIKVFSSLRIDGLDRLSLKNRLNEIGRLRLEQDAGADTGVG